VLGPRPSAEAIRKQLAALDRQQRPGPVSNPLPPKQYRAARDRITEGAKKQPVLWKRGQWYDDVDNHVHCS